MKKPSSPTNEYICLTNTIWSRSWMARICVSYSRCPGFKSLAGRRLQSM